MVMDHKLHKNCCQVLRFYTDGLTCSFCLDSFWCSNLGITDISAVCQEDPPGDKTRSLRQGVPHQGSMLGPLVFSPQKQTCLTKKQDKQISLYEGSSLKLHTEAFEASSSIQSNIQV